MKFNKKSLSLVGVVLVLASVLFVGQDCHATTSVSLSPMNQRILLMPGETYEASIKITNIASATQNLEYSVSVGSFSENGGEDNIDDYGNVNVDSVSSYNQIIDWIQLEKISGVVEPNGTDVIPFSIMVPKDAPAGGQYATIIVRNDTVSGSSNNGGVGVAINSDIQIASIIYAEVAGETREVGSILENNAPSFLLSGPLEAISRVRNDGNVHTDAKFTLQVWPLFSGEEICTNEENPTTSLILPDSERFHTETCNLPAVGIFKLKQTVEIFGETDILEKTVIICPLWLMFVVAIVVAALVIWLFVRARGRKR